jgi:phage-related tail fiber protein
MTTKFAPNNDNATITIVARAGDKAKYNAEREVANVRFVASRSWQSDKETAVNGYDSAEAWFDAAAWKHAALRAAEINKGDVIEVKFSLADLVADAYTNKDGQPAASLKIARSQMRVIVPKSASNDTVEASELEAQDVEL